MNSLERIKSHFEQEADQYDNIIRRLIPFYPEMVDALVTAVLFDSNVPILRVMDLGCGTGTISAAIQKKFPQASFTCVDIAENMLSLAKYKMGEKHSFICTDFQHLEFPEKYDLIVSSLALHHLETSENKQAFYHKINAALVPGGIFINADVVTGSNDAMQKMYMQKWVGFMNRQVEMREIEEKWLPNYYAEDRPVPLMSHLEMLKSAGFIGLDVVWKYYNYVVYTGMKG